MSHYLPSIPRICLSPEIKTNYFSFFISDRIEFFFFLVMRYYCQCLNVTIDILQINDNPQILTRMNLLNDLNPSQEWFECNILSDKSIHILWQCLFQSISIRDMKLNRCLACNQYTHIITTESNKILINKDLLVCKKNTTIKQIIYLF
jgi:hypothetical protein